MTTDAKRRIARRLRGRREQLGRTQEELAQAAGLRHRQTITAIEAEDRSVSATELASLARVLDVGVSYFTDRFVATGEAAFSIRAESAPDEDVADLRGSSGAVGRDLSRARGTTGDQALPPAAGPLPLAGLPVRGRGRGRRGRTGTARPRTVSRRGARDGARTGLAHSRPVLRGPAPDLRRRVAPRRAPGDLHQPRRVAREAQLRSRARALPPPHVGHSRVEAGRSAVRAAAPSPPQCSMRVPITSRKFASHAGCAGHAGAVTRLPSTKASSTAMSCQSAPAAFASGPHAG